MIEAILLAIGVFGLFLIVHIVLFHFRTPMNRWKVVQRLAILFLIGYVALYYLLPESNWLGILSTSHGLPKLIACINGALLYLFLFVTYGQVYFLIDRGVSARIMIELLTEGARGMTQEEIAGRYSPVALERRRLDDMIYGKYLFIEGEQYHLTKKGTSMGRAFLFLKHLLRLFPGG